MRLVSRRALELLGLLLSVQRSDDLGRLALFTVMLPLVLSPEWLGLISEELVPVAGSASGDLGMRGGVYGCLRALL